ncbi:MAG: formate dehydrogenase accessory sulfurtransferase FdhD, partial [Clostridia bacterium]|nr:formate dehydrogenase accessory sulfurtransferase FdhD [Clostridia bacterium]
MKVIQSFEITRIKGDRRIPMSDSVIREHRHRIFVGGEPYADLICIAQDLEALTVGHLMNEGAIRGREDLLALTVDEQGAHVTLAEAAPLIETGVRTVGTGLGAPRSAAFRALEKRAPEPLVSSLTFRLEDIVPLVESFQESSELFTATGGVHSCALCDSKGKLLYFMEDLGRHNAFDKVIGAALLDGISPSECFLMTSGRVPSDMLIKAVKARLPLVVSRSAPTDVAIEMAVQYGVTLCGFARGDRMNLYT